MAFLAIPALVGTAAAGTTAAGIGVAAVGVGMIASGVSAYGALKQGRAANSEAQFAADQQEQQSAVSAYNARNALDNATREAAELSDIRIRNLASQQAEVAGSGIRVTGSALDVMRDTTVQAEKAIAMIKWRGRTEAYNYGTEAKSLMTSSTYTRAAGKNAKKSSYWSAAGTILSGAARAGSNYFSTYQAANA